MRVNRMRTSKLITLVCSPILQYICNYVFLNRPYKANVHCEPYINVNMGVCLTGVLGSALIPLLFILVMELVRRKVSTTDVL